MVKIIVFGPGADPAMYEQLMERARAVAAGYEDRVVLEERSERDASSAALRIAGAPAIAVNDDVVAVRAVPSARRLMAAVERHLTRGSG